MNRLVHPQARLVRSKSSHPTPLSASLPLVKTLFNPPLCPTFRPGQNLSLISICCTCLKVNWIQPPKHCLYPPKVFTQPLSLSASPTCQNLNRVASLSHLHTWTKSFFAFFGGNLCVPKVLPQPFIYPPLGRLPSASHTSVKTSQNLCPNNSPCLFHSNVHLIGHDQ